MAPDAVQGGTDAVSALLEWVMSELVRNPRVMKKAQDEVRRLRGRKIITEFDLAKLDFLRLVIKETLRLHPVVPLIPRVCQETLNLLGHEICKGTTVLVNVWSIAVKSLAAVVSQYKELLPFCTGLSFMRLGSNRDKRSHYVVLLFWNKVLARTICTLQHLLSWTSQPTNTNPLNRYISKKGYNVIDRAMFGWGKGGGGKRLGKGGTMHHRKVLKDNIQDITKTCYPTA
ncbi:Ent-isokaurene C2-hydroxylase [Carex littledalei]|uniref:Ent-isokaurene C2-hydroxylase n=1 Tax=Carex littledalei TaxID=544730 RepID=A0A833VX20_9POAL|nr:Ent-isokaurene C2-hydroxylase [Carex littledalei]